MSRLTDEERRTNATGGRPYRASPANEVLAKLLAQVSEAGELRQPQIPTDMGPQLDTPKRAACRRMGVLDIKLIRRREESRLD